MALETPTLSEIYARNITDFIISYNTSSDSSEHIDPSLRNNPEGALVYTLSQQADSLYKIIKEASKQLFIDTATGEFLDRLAVEIGITRNPATTASGNVTFTGNTGITIPNGTSLTKTDGSLYTTKAAGLTAVQTISVSNLIRSGTTATATTSSDHTIAVGMDITIAGANETAYNGTFTVVSIPAANQFTYTVSGSPSTPATGTITASYDGVSIEVESDDSGQKTNIESGGQLSLATPIAGIDNTVYVQFDGITGGTNEETDENFRERVLFKKQNPHALFNSAEIESKAKEVSGVTRVWVEEITPNPGQVTIYFTRDDDSSIIPSATEVSDVKNSILEIKPAHVADADVIVSAPVGVTIPITFSSLSPNTAEMQTAITESLTEFFKSENNVSENETLNQINNAIFNTIDDTGTQPSSFTLSAPVADVVISTGEIGLLGTITYP
jgi:uncharacterized phage protein gp47/JayE